MQELKGMTINENEVTIIGELRNERIKTIINLNELLTINKKWYKGLKYEDNSIGEYVTIYCDNGAKYEINVTCNSDMALVMDVLTRVAYK